ncbi:ABC transporter permease [Shinella sp. BYT-45]|uniref:ABC transporter permease n=1 Tax=Shinella sp. BYT-45 TaxID=3377377 RepID=UPI00397FCEEE
MSTGPDSFGPAIPLRSRLRFGLEWLSVVPFIVFALMFLAAPTVSLVVQAFTDRAGDFTLDNIRGLATDQIVRAYTISIQISLASALLGAIFGLLIALALIRGRLPHGLRAAVMTFSGVASNFAGVPLAFAFIATLGRLGLVTLILREAFGFDLYRTGFTLFSFWGLTLTYLYFQIPLMVVIITPAVDGLKREWSEAAETLGASTWHFWRYVGLPILWPPFLGTLSLLFANAFGAIATAWALTGSNLNIVTVLLYNQIRGDALQNPGLGAALAIGMVVITSITNIIYLVAAKRAERWMK